MVAHAGCSRCAGAGLCGLSPPRTHLCPFPEPHTPELRVQARRRGPHLRLQRIQQLPAPHQLHDEVHPVVLHKVLPHPHHVGMVQVQQDINLLQQAQESPMAGRPNQTLGRRDWLPKAKEARAAQQ